MNLLASQVYKSLLDHMSRRNSYDDDIVLLKVNLQRDDDVRVGDYECICEAFNIDYGRPAAMVDYCRSVTKLRDKFNAAASMELPEVVCFNSIQADRIELDETIPAKTIEEIRTYVEKKKEAENNPSTPTTRSPPAASANRPKRSAP
jgi:hypothetical protein